MICMFVETSILNSVTPFTLSKPTARILASFWHLVITPLVPILFVEILLVRVLISTVCNLILHSDD